MEDKIVRSMPKIKNVASNTILLYIRMLFVMGVSLFTSRINIQALGLEDYGLFNIVAGIIGLVTFLNSALGTSSSRFITITLGRGDISDSKLLFSTIYKVHFLLGVIVMFIAEIIGIYLVNEVLSIPANRLFACNVIFQCSIVIMFINLINIPMTASIIAHERFNIFAYIGIYEVIAKLLSSYLLFVWLYDKLILWGVLNLLISISLCVFYLLYGKKRFDEFSIKEGFDKVIARQITSFSFWNLLGSLSIALKNSGVNIVLNIFFGPLVNAANAIAYQVNNAITNFSANFTTAINPQIFKTFAQGKYQETETLVHWGGKLSFLLVAILGLPLILEIEYVLNIWLKEYPVYTPTFCKLIIILSWIESFNYSIGTAIQASGKIKAYQLIVSGLSLFNLPLTYCAFKLGANSFVALEIAIGISIITLIARIFFIKKILGFSRVFYLKNVLGSSFLMIVTALLICLFMQSNMEKSLSRFIFISFLSTICNLLFFYLFIDKEYKTQIKSMLIKRIKRI